MPGLEMQNQRGSHGHDECSCQLDKLTAAKTMTVDFSRSPFLVIWEVTRACALACVHCRADAIPRRDPGELTTDEGYALINAVRGMGADSLAERTAKATEQIVLNTKELVDRAKQGKLAFS